MQLARISLRCFAFLPFFALCIGCGGEPDTTGSKSAPGASKSTTASPSPSAPSKTAKETSAPIAAGWGHLKGRFTYGGDAPSASPLNITTDKDYCGKHEVLDESVVVNSDNKGVANVVVYLYLKRDEAAPTAHESYQTAAGDKVTLDNNQCRFEPHVCLLRTSQTLVVKNSDTVGHNTNIAAADNVSFNQTVPVGSAIDVTFKSPERRPAPVNCNIHPWMKGWVLPQETPYFAVTDANGDFEIKNLPSGNWTFQVWHEAVGGLAEVTIDGQSTKWSKGRVDIAIQPDEATDLGNAVIAPTAFQ